MHYYYFKSSTILTYILSEEHDNNIKITLKILLFLTFSFVAFMGINAVQKYYNIQLMKEFPPSTFDI